MINIQMIQDLHKHDMLISTHDQQMTLRSAVRRMTPVLHYNENDMQHRRTRLELSTYSSPTSIADCCCDSKTTEKERLISGFPRLRQNKITRLFQLTLKHFQAFRRAIYL